MGLMLTVFDERVLTGNIDQETESNRRMEKTEK
jgi:hypothetical protein